MRHQRSWKKSAGSTSIISISFSKRKPANALRLSHEHPDGAGEASARNDGRSGFGHRLAGRLSQRQLVYARVHAPRKMRPPLDFRGSSMRKPSPDLLSGGAPMSFIVCKFGGTSVATAGKTATDRRNPEDRNPPRRCVVCRAPGKAAGSREGHRLPHRHCR